MAKGLKYTQKKWDKKLKDFSKKIRKLKVLQLCGECSGVLSHRGAAQAEAAAKRGAAATDKPEEDLQRVLDVYEKMQNEVNDMLKMFANKASTACVRCRCVVLMYAAHGRCLPHTFRTSNSASCKAFGQTSMPCCMKTRKQTVVRATQRPRRRMKSTETLYVTVAFVLRAQALTAVLCRMSRAAEAPPLAFRSVLPSTSTCVCST